MLILKIIRKFFFLLLVTTCSTGILSAQTTPTREYQLKAIFLINFSQFVEWPASSFSTDKAPLVIGVFGNDPFGTYLTEAVLGEKVNDHPIVIQHYKTFAEIQTCHILYINKAETNLEQLEASLKGQSVLKVSDRYDFLEQGGMIKFYTKNNKIQLQINLETTKEANLVISSKLLRLAEIYVPIKK